MKACVRNRILSGASFDDDDVIPANASSPANISPV
jgi:hypothetical protein